MWETRSKPFANKEVKLSKTGSSWLLRQVARWEERSTSPGTMTLFWLTRVRRDGCPSRPPSYLPLSWIANNTGWYYRASGAFSVLPGRVPWPRQQSWWWVGWR